VPYLPLPDTDPTKDGRVPYPPLPDIAPTKAVTCRRRRCRAPPRKQPSRALPAAAGHRPENSRRVRYPPLPGTAPKKDGRVPYPPSPDTAPKKDGRVPYPPSPDTAPKKAVACRIRRRRTRPQKNTAASRRCRYQADQTYTFLHLFL